MKHLIQSLGLALILSAATAYAEGDKTERPNPQQHLDKLASELQLSDLQKTEVASILKSTHEQRRALGREQKEEHKALREETRQKLSTILNEEQMSKLDDLHKSRAKRHKRAKFFEGESEQES